MRPVQENDVFHAIAHPARRAILVTLKDGERPANELAEPFRMTFAAISQHLRVLEDAGVVTSEKLGRVRTVSLRPGALDVLHLWLGEQRTPAERDADRLGIHLTRTITKEI